MDAKHSLTLLLPGFQVTEAGDHCLLVTVTSDRDLRYLRQWIDGDLTAQWVDEKTVAVFFSRGNYSVA